MVFVETPNSFTWIGVTLVLGSLLAIGVERIREAARNSADPITTPSKRYSDLVLANDPEDDAKTYNEPEKSYSRPNHDEESGATK